MSILDIHSHALPGIDDGSRNVETSIAMLQAAGQQGVEVQALTPHFYANRNRIPSFLENREYAWQKIKDNLPENCPNLVLGAEVAFFDGISRADEIGALCIGETNLLLLEMPFAPWNDRVMEEVDQLVNSRGFQIVLAHLERFTEYRPNRPYIKELLESKCLVQVNAETLLSFKSRLGVMKWFKEGKVDFLGSDAHGMHRRPPNLLEGREVLLKKLGPAALEKIDANANLLKW